MHESLIKWLQVENTTKCNAWCPGCGRNKDGYGLADNLVIQDLDLDKFEQVLKQFTRLQTVQFCGTYGDTAAAGNALDQIRLAKRYVNHIQIHTHGGLRNTDWWTELAYILAGSEHRVWFALDGLKGVHEIYRQGTDFDKAIENAQAFISAGGHAVWQFIPWAHNEHQMMDCLRLSQTMKFKKFHVIRNVRKDFHARDYKTGEPIDIQPWSQDTANNKYEQSNRTVSWADCRHLTEPSVYLNANGQLSPCCFFNTHRAVDDFESLANIKIEIENNQPNQQCLHSCGTCATIEHHDAN